MNIWVDFVGYVFTLICGLFSFVLGISTDFFGLLPNSSNAGFAALGASLLILLIGDRVTCGLREREAIRQMNEVVGQAFSNMPLMDVITEFSSSNDALNYLCSRLPYATVALNTRISDIGVVPRQDIDSKWAKVILKHVEEGLIFKDIVSPAFEKHANLMLSSSEKAAGKYEFAMLAHTPPSYLNFIVLEFENGDQEVLIGWATSVYKGMEQRAYKVRDRRMISYFREYHEQLYMLTKSHAS